MTDDPFPEAPSYEELEEMKPEPEEMFKQAQNDESPATEWYNQAVQVAARLIVEAAQEYDEFREYMLEENEFGAAHAMSEYDEDRHQKLNTMGLSAFQGGSAENLARRYLSDDD